MGTSWELTGNLFALHQSCLPGMTSMQQLIKKEARKKNPFSAQMLVLNAIEKTDLKCYCLLDSGAYALVLLKEDSMQGSEAQCTGPGGGVVPGLVTSGPSSSLWH